MKPQETHLNMLFLLKLLFLLIKWLFNTNTSSSGQKSQLPKLIFLARMTSNILLRTKNNVNLYKTKIKAI